MAHCKASGGCLAVAHRVNGGTPCMDPLPGTLPTSTPSTPPPAAAISAALTTSAASSIVSTSSIPSALPQISARTPALPATSSHLPALPLSLSACTPALPSIINALPNPRHASQMAPIFIAQVETEMALGEARRLQDEQRINAIKKLKESVMVYAWAKVVSISLFKHDRSDG
jgi:hypothetical protein